MASSSRDIALLVLGLFLGVAYLACGLYLVMWLYGGP